MKNLGLMCGKGEGVILDYAEAVKWYRKAAEQGNLGAQNNLGWLHSVAAGIHQSHSEAVPPAL